MSLTQIEDEILLFLMSDSVEVICIKGKWGVGKTFGWKKFVLQAKQSNRLAFDKYSYVSLFGLNSLDDLKYAIFERTVSGTAIGKDPDANSFKQLVDKGSLWTRKMMPVFEGIGAFFNRKGVADILFKTAFLSVQKQLICLDDLERAGAGLHVRDVLGLVSYLKEERGCKVALLLNDEEHDQKVEFQKQLEKVSDITMSFDLTPHEAVEIALPQPDKRKLVLKSRISELPITNIRVIKKIEKQLDRLIVVLDNFDEGIFDQAITTLVLASWATQQPKQAPSIEFLRSYNKIALAMRAAREKVDDNTARHRALIENYPFRGADAFDRLIIDGAKDGFFKSSELKAAAQELQDKKVKQGVESEFSRVWDELYHGSLATDDNTFLDALYNAATKESAAITPLNINSTVRVLRENGRTDEADKLIAGYIRAHKDDGPNFFNIRKQHFIEEDQLDDSLREAFESERLKFIDSRDPLEVMLSIGERRGWNVLDIALLAKQSSADFERMFESIHGDALRPTIEMILAAGNSHEEGAGALKVASRDALQRIADKSPIRARKLASYGFVPSDKADVE